MSWSKAVCSIQVRLNSPSDSVTTISDPARMPGRAFGTMISLKRRHGKAPSESRAIVQCLDIGRAEHRQHRTDHEGQRENHMPDQNEQPGTAKIAKPAVGTICDLRVGDPSWMSPHQCMSKHFYVQFPE